MGSLINKNNLPTVAALIVPALWGIYWIPLQYLETYFNNPTSINIMLLVIACIVLLPIFWLSRKNIGSINKKGVFFTILGGASFTLFSVALSYGNVATIIILFYMTPVWSILISRVSFGTPISAYRCASILLGLTGVILVLYNGNALTIPLPKSLGDWFGLLSGILWSISSIGMNKNSKLNAISSNLLFCIGGLIMAIYLGWVLDDPTPDSAETKNQLMGFLLLAVIGILWWAFSLTALMWAVSRLDPTRLGIFMMTEVVVGAVSSALFSNHPYGAAMFIGTIFVILAGILEALSGHSVEPQLHSKQAH